MALTQGLDYHLAEDAAQEGFLEAFRRLASLERARSFPAWLSVIVQRQALRLAKARRAGGEPLKAAERVPDPRPEPEKIFEHREAMRDFGKALAALPEAQRLTAALYYLHENSVSRIAEILQVPVTTVKKRLHDARDRLRGKWSRAGRDDLQYNEAPVDVRLVDALELRHAVAADPARVAEILRRRPGLARLTLYDRDPRGDTLLHRVMPGDGAELRPEHLEIARLLLDRGAASDARRGSGTAGSLWY